MENADKNAELIFGQIRGLASSITSHSLDLNQSLPFVTLPHFDLRAQQAGVAAGSELIMFAPIVSQEDVQYWEEYGIEHQEWMAQDLVSTPKNLQQRRLYYLSRLPPPIPRYMYSMSPFDSPQICSLS